MSFEKKYFDSIDIANYAYNNNKFDIAVNRFYYGVFQKMLCKINNMDDLKGKYESLSKNGSHNSHNDTIHLYSENVLAKRNTGKKGLRSKMDFNRHISDLKSLRQIADYQDRLISDVEAKQAKVKFESLIKIIDS